MGAFDAIIQLLLYACYGVYVVMGLVLLILGIVYMGDAGAIGTTGIWLCAAGFIMLIIGGLAIFANLKEIWLVLFVIELVNVALFLGLYIIIVVVVMMASGTTDPIRRATTEGWDETRQSMTLVGSDGTSDGIYCETQTASTACTTYYALAKSATDSCNLGVTDTDVRNGLLNCTAIKDTANCGGLASQCSACDNACMEQQITDVKEAILPMSIFVFCLVVYLFIVTSVNTIASHHDDPGDGLFGILGLVLNCLLALFAFILVIMGIAGAVQADDAGGDVPTSMIVTLLTGVGILAVAVLAVLAIKVLGNTFLLQVATGVMVFFCIFLTLMALLLGISSGAVMDDMDYYYEQNYPKLRSAMEKADNSYCQMSKAECTELTLNGKPAPVKDDDGKEISGVAKITANEVWKAQYAEAASEAAKDGAASWLTPCKTTGICIYCKDFVLHAENSAVGVYDKSANQTVDLAHVEGEWCDFTSTSKPAACVKAAEKIDWEKSLRWASDAVKTKKITNYKPPATITKDSTDDPEWLADELDNYTKANNKAPIGSTPRGLASQMGYCELAIGNYVTDDKKCPETTPAADATTYKADCGECVSAVGNKFSFAFSNSGKDYMKCSNFVMGHINLECEAPASGAATCRDQFTGNSKSGPALVTKAAATGHVNTFVDAALAADSRSAFCGYSDRACKAKIKDAVENSMTAIGIFGCIFLVFFLAILFFTMHAINYYRGGGGGDDDDDDDDDSDE
jgi:hypothetical protein